MNMTPKQLATANAYSIFPQPAGLFVSLKTDAHKTFKTKFAPGTCFRSRRKLKSAWEFFRATETGVESISAKAFLEFIDSATPPAETLTAAATSAVNTSIEEAAKAGHPKAKEEVAKAAASVPPAPVKQKKATKSAKKVETKTKKVEKKPVVKDEPKADVAPVAVEAAPAKPEPKSKKSSKKADKTTSTTEVAVVSPYVVAVVLGQELAAADKTLITQMIANAGIRVSAPSSLSGIHFSIVRTAEGNAIAGFVAGRPRDNSYIDTINSRTGLQPRLPNDALEFCWVRTSPGVAANDVEAAAAAALKTKATELGKKLFAVYNTSNASGIATAERLGGVKHNRTHAGMSKEAQLLLF